MYLVLATGCPTLASNLLGVLLVYISVNLTKDIHPIHPVIPASLLKLDFVSSNHLVQLQTVTLLKLGISLSFDKKYFARKSLSFRNIFAISIRLI